MVTNEKRKNTTKEILSKRKILAFEERNSSLKLDVSDSFFLRDIRRPFCLNISKNVYLV